MVNLREKPFCLDDEQAEWVSSTIASMSLSEKVGQLFICLLQRRDPDYYRMMIEQFHIGGIRWQGGTKEEIYEQNRFFQENSPIPVLIAANCEAGGNGALAEGTLVGTAAACGAAGDPDCAYRMAEIGGKEAAAVGCNWTFGPVSDVLLNWRNTVVNLRSFGNDPEAVADCCLSYVRAMKAAGLACATKHFPGDGAEERDQHLVMGCNDLSCEEWDRTYGAVYRKLIDEGIESFMIGHICLPAYSRRMVPGISDGEIMPATLSGELLNGLLREQLGFNGLIVTDASHMIGMMTKMPRKEALPRAIAAGCDMLLFLNDNAEDIQYVTDGVKNGIISEERLQDALMRILGLKAKLNLFRKAFPEKEGLSVIGCAGHKLAAAELADRAVTLVKNRESLLPVTPEKYPRVRLYFIRSAPRQLTSEDRTRALVIKELEAAGFTVSVSKDYYDLEAEHPSPFNQFRMMEKDRMEEFKDSFDWVLVVSNIVGYAQQSNMRIAWSSAHSYELPWFVREVPTVAVSLSYTTHLYDLPMMETFINAYSSTPEYIHAVVEKITGKSEFKGKYNELVWCDRWDTRI